jgi:signal peptidase I
MRVRPALPQGHLTVVCTGATRLRVEAPTMIDAARDAHIDAGARLSAALWPLLRLVGLALALALLVRVLIVQPFAIPSGSMAPTLTPGDFVLVDKRAYGWSLASLPMAPPLMRPNGTSEARLGGMPVEPGDVIAFVGPDGRDYVKRVVARGGDRVSMSAGVLRVNGQAIPCVPAPDGLCRETLPNGASHLIQSNGTGPTSDLVELVVPQGHYFVLGDNRDASADSRVARADGGVGMVPDGQVIGQAAAIFLSVGTGVRWDRVGQPID